MTCKKVPAQIKREVENLVASKSTTLEQPAQLDRKIAKRSAVQRFSSFTELLLADKFDFTHPTLQPGYVPINAVQPALSTTGNLAAPRV